MKQKLKFGKPLKIVITIVSIFIFTILVHYLSVDLVDNNYIDATRSFRVTQDLLSALAETPGTAKTSETKTIESSSTHLNPTKTQENDYVGLNRWLGLKYGLSSQMLVMIMLLIGFIILTLALLSIVSLNKDHTTLKEKSDFLLQTFPKILEGITVVFIVIVIGTLGIGGQEINPATVSILSAIVGYVFGQKSSELTSKRKDRTINSQNNPTNEIDPENKF
jgi:hypothetical protein